MSFNAIRENKILAKFSESTAFVLSHYFVMQCLLFFLVFNHLAEEERTGCVILIVFLLTCGC